MSNRHNIHQPGAGGAPFALNVSPTIEFSPKAIVDNFDAPPPAVPADNTSIVPYGPSNIAALVTPGGGVAGTIAWIVNSDVASDFYGSSGLSYLPVGSGNYLQVSIAPPLGVVINPKLTYVAASGIADENFSLDFTLRKFSPADDPDGSGTLLDSGTEIFPVEDTIVHQEVFESPVTSGWANGDIVSLRIVRNDNQPVLMNVLALHF